MGGRDPAGLGRGTGRWEVARTSGNGGNGLAGGVVEVGRRDDVQARLLDDLAALFDFGSFQADDQRDPESDLAGGRHDRFGWDVDGPNETWAYRVGKKAAGRLLDGRFRLIDCIGRGGMASVYRGEHTTLGRPVAIKVLSPALAGLLLRPRKAAIARDPRTLRGRADRWWLPL